MKSNKKSNYSRLERKIIIQVALILASAILLVFILRSLLQGHFANGVVYLLINTFYLAPDDAKFIYRIVFRNNMQSLMIITVIVLVIVLFRFAISRFTKYFDEISTAMDKLAEESNDYIALSPELDFMEDKLNQIKSSLEKQKQAVQEAEQRKNDLVVYLAHDIKTPLTSVIGYLSLLDEAPDMPAEQKAKYVGITLEKAYRLEELINEFFEITRFNLGSIVLNKARIKLSLMLQQMADEFYPILAPEGKKASVNVPDNLVLWGDADKLARVFNNILKNAVAYSYENSTINIAAENQGENVVITFSNQGDQIPEQKLNAIFEKFYRLDSSRSSRSGGAGLGLAIAKEIVTVHGGTITVESSQQQTVFTVILPSDIELRKS